MLQQLEQQLNYSFKDTDLLVQALTHKSFHNENSKVSKGHNERLEFLGDAVLDLSISHFLMINYPQIDEGQLSKMRASLVNEDFLSTLSLKLNLSEFMKLGKGEQKSGGADKPRLLASVFEAIVGAIYLDSGYEAAHKVLTTLFKEECKDLEISNHQSQDYKTQLQEAVQASFKQTPVYKVLSESGPDHDKDFSVEVSIKERVLGQGFGKSKKQAEQQAALRALESLKS